MQTEKKKIAVGWLWLLVVAALLLCPFPGQHAALPASPPIETMTMEALDQLMTGSRGVHLLFFTAAWCGHCKAMLPTLNRLYQRFHPRGLQFVAISIDAGGPSAMQRVLNDQRVDFPVVWVGEAVVDKLRLIGIPMIILVKDGRQVEKIPGKCSYGFLEAKIKDRIQ